MKQTTNNKSTKVDSCLKGWRLMGIICSYYRASDALKPYLLKYLENNAFDLKRPYNCKDIFRLENLENSFNIICFFFKRLRKYR